MLSIPQAVVVIAVIVVILTGVLPVLVMVVFAFLGAEDGPGAAYVTTYTSGVDLHGAGTTETWEIVLDLDSGITRGLSTSSRSHLHVEVFSDSPDIPLIEIIAGPPIGSDEEVLRHPARKWERPVHWPIEIPDECLDGCRLVFPIQVTQLGEGSLAYFDIRTSLQMNWDTVETTRDVLGEVQLSDRVTIELAGPNRNR
jgi:hypothetical protein